MKKLLAFGIVLCVLLMSLALADGEEMISDGSPIRLEDFTLNVDAGTKYTISDKSAGEVLIIFYPRAASGDTASNINASWAGGLYDVTTDMLDSIRDSMKESIISGYKTAGYTVGSMELGNSFDFTLAGEPCVALDNLTNLSSGSISINVYQRLFYFGAKGYVFTVSAPDEETRESLCEMLNACLVWN